MTLQIAFFLIGNFVGMLLLLKCNFAFSNPGSRQCQTPLLQRISFFIVSLMVMNIIGISESMGRTHFPNIRLNMPMIEGS